MIEFLFIVFCIYVFAMFIFFGRRLYKYEYQFEELEKIIVNLEKEFENLNQLEIEAYRVNKEELKGNSWFPSFSLLWVNFERKTEFKANEVYEELFDEYYQREKERNQFFIALSGAFLLAILLGAAINYFQ